MSEASAWKFILSSLELATLISLPLLAGITVAGLLTSVAQALTQLQEQTVGFVMKVLVTLAFLRFLGPWQLHLLSENLKHVLQEFSR